MTIHREGRTLLIVLLVILLAGNGAIFYFFPGALFLQYTVLVGSILFYLLILQFFRLPLFAVQRNDRAVIAPADGKVVVIEETTETEYLKSRRIQVSIFMSPVNVHVNRMPVSGAISYLNTIPANTSWPGIPSRVPRTNEPLS